MTDGINRNWGWGVAGLAAIGILPVLLFFIAFGRAPSISAQEARRMLGDINSDAVLIDVRSPGEFGQKHISGSVNWPYAEIERLTSSAEIPAGFRHRSLLIICNVGLVSARAVLKLEAITSVAIYNVQGGIQEWGRGLAPGSGGLYAGLSNSDGEIAPLPYRDTPLGLQWVACLAAFGVKPLYMTLTLVLIVVLWRRHSTDLRALKRGLIFFLAGEGVCALNYVFFGEDSFLLEYLHSLGMVVAFGFVIYAVLDGFEQRILNINHPKEKCAGLSMCARCIKYEDTYCGAMRLVMLLAIFLAVCALIPWLSAPQAVSYNTRLLGGDYFYSHPVIYQYFETRYAPAAAIVLYLAAVPLLGGRQGSRFTYGRMGFSAATGLLGFAFFRLVLLSIYRDNLAWFVIWEEASELMFIGTVAAVLFLFRVRLFDQHTSPVRRL